MTWRTEILEISQPTHGRVAPTFGAHHVAVVITMIGREQPLGRYELCERTSIGEGSVRTLLKRLKESDIVKAEGKQGQKLTVKGSILFDKITKDIPLGLSLDLGDLVVHEYAFAHVVRGKADSIKDGIRQRDEAIIKGGPGNAGATTLVQRDGLLLMPPDNFNILLAYEQETLLISETLRVEDGDVIVIGSAMSENLAREVSMAAVLTIFEE